MNINPEVTSWFEAYENPHKALMLEIRAFILAADGRIAECIKWQTPTFTYRGNIASFNPRSKKHVSLMFHTGATIPGEHPRLHISGDTAAYMTFADAADFHDQREALTTTLTAWITAKDLA